MTLTIKHLDLLIHLRKGTKKSSLLSATKLKLTTELIALALLKIDEEDFIFLTEQGDNLLDFIVETFTSWGINNETLSTNGI